MRVNARKLGRNSITLYDEFRDRVGPLFPGTLTCDILGVLLVSYGDFDMLLTGEGLGKQLR